MPGTTGPIHSFLACWFVAIHVGSFDLVCVHPNSLIWLSILHLSKSLIDRLL